MPPPPILSSPFLTHSALDSVLSNSTSPQDRIQFLSAKIHLYANDLTSTPSTSGNPPTQLTKQTADGREVAFTIRQSSNGPPAARWAESKDELRIPEMKTRLDLAAVQLGAAKGSTTGLAYSQQAEATLRIVLDWTRGVMKGAERRQRVTAERAGAVGKGVAGDGTSTCTPGGGVDGELQAKVDTGWIAEVLDVRRRALQLTIQLGEGMGRTGRIDALSRQLADLEGMQRGG